MNNSGSTALLVQYFKKGWVVVARNRQRLLCNMNVVMFQLMMNTPNATPTMAPLQIFTLPRYSGEKNNPLHHRFS